MRLVPLLSSALFICALVSAATLLHPKTRPSTADQETVAVTRRTIVKTTVIPGAVLPRREVAIKPRVSGIVEKLYVAPGVHVKERSLLARVQIVPNMVNLNRAESGLLRARINMETAGNEYARAERLKAYGLLPEADFARRDLEFKLWHHEVRAAEDNLQLVRGGASPRSGQSSNLVWSTVEGTVLDVPVEVGGSVIEANTFNEGTTIATVANMDDVIFKGAIEETDVDQLKSGMDVSIAIGALLDECLDGVLEYVAPKGMERDGTVEFEVRASVKLKQSVHVRANYSANASVVLGRRENALAIDEAWIRHEYGRAFVELETSPQTFQRREIVVGLSDGANVEVLAGLKDGSFVRKRAPGPTGRVAARN